MNLVFDIETDDLKATKIWCIVAINDDNKVFTFGPDLIDEGVKFLNSAETLIGHNILGFDIPVIKKLTGVDLSKNKKIYDTLTLSRLFNPTREGGHSLERWGIKLNYHKKESPDFTCYSDDMLQYCISDTKLNKILFNFLKKEGLGFTKQCLEIEHETTKILVQQQKNGFKFDTKKATVLASNLNKLIKQTEDEVHKTFKPRWVEDKMVNPFIKKDGTLSKRGLTAEEYATCLKNKNFEPFMRKTLQHFNLGSRKQIGEYLQDFGWKPTKFTPTNQPIVDETTLKDITHIHEAKLIANFLLYQKRLAQVQSWLESVEDDDRIHGSVICTGTITGRMAHRGPNVAQVPSVKSEFGTECRSCWTVEDGYKLVGVDASGLELRMLAHYMDDERYTNEIISGDIHRTNQKLVGLESRDKAKTFIYALIYGAGDEKIGKIVDGDKKSGKQLKQRFLAGQPSFKHLRERVQNASKRGYIKGLDGRKIILRHQHAALNSLLQGGGAIVMKKALCILNDKLKLVGMDYKFVANIHDEWQIEVRACQARRVGEMAVQALVEAGDYFNLRCPLDGEYKIGVNWSETH